MIRVLSRVRTRLSLRYRAQPPFVAATDTTPFRLRAPASRGRLHSTLSCPSRSAYERAESARKQTLAECWRTDRSLIARRADLPGAILRRHGVKETGRWGLPAESVLRWALLKQHRFAWSPSLRKLESGLGHDHASYPGQRDNSYVLHLRSRRGPMANLRKRSISLPDLLPVTDLNPSTGGRE